MKIVVGKEAVALSVKTGNPWVVLAVVAVFLVVAVVVVAK